MGVYEVRFSHFITYRPEIAECHQVTIRTFLIVKH